MTAPDPTPDEIVKRRAEIHRAKGEHKDAQWILEEYESGLVNLFPEDEETEPAFKTIHELGLPARITSQLELHGVYLAGDLCGWTEERLRLIKPFGDGSVQQIRDALASIDLSLRAAKIGEIVPALPGKMEQRVPRRAQVKLTDRQIEQMFQLMAQRSSQRQIARTLGIDRWTVWNRLRIFKEAVKSMFGLGASDKQVRKRVGRDRWCVWQLSREWDQRKKHQISLDKPVSE